MSSAERIRELLDDASLSGGRSKWNEGQRQRLAAALRGEVEHRERAHTHHLYRGHDCDSCIALAAIEKALRGEK